MQKFSIFACALGASAFLLPSSLDSEAFPLVAVNPKTQSVNLQCSSCVPLNQEISLEEDEDIWVQGGAQDLLLNFSIADDGRHLLLNGDLIFPFDNAKEVPTTWLAEQVTPGSVAGEEVYITHMALNEAISASKDDENSFVHIDMKIHELNGLPHDIDHAVIDMIRLEDGELLILAIDAQRPAPFRLIAGPPPSFKPHQRPCHLPGPLCALSDFVHSKFGGKPCPGKLNFDGEHVPGHIRPHMGRPRPDFGGRHGPGGHGRHHGHHRHGFFGAVSRGILAIIVPIMAGITVGIIVSVSGLLFGRFIGYMWYTVIRGNRQSYVSLSADDISERASMDKEALPLYEEAPPYEDTPEKQ